jgi:4-hydroxy-tetrahydrodipicolinate synthase
MSIFSGIWIPVVTPFAHGVVDHEALAAMVRRQAQAGVAGFVALGTTGEPAALDAAEQAAVLATILRAAGPLPVVAGVSGNQVASVREQIAMLNEKPIAGLLISAPYYVRPSQAGLIDYFSTLADTSAKPILLYDIPQRTGVRIDLPTLLTLAEHPRIVGVKDCSGSLETTLALILDGRLQVLCGEDLNLFGTLCMGGSGGITASAHVQPERFVAMYRALAEGRLNEGRALWHALVPLVRALFAEPNPAPVKAALAALGVMRNELRVPMTPVSPALQRQLETLLAG